MAFVNQPPETETETETENLTTMMTWCLRFLIRWKNYDSFY